MRYLQGHWRLIVLIAGVFLAILVWLADSLHGSSELRLQNVGGRANQCTCSQRIER
jgi:hypothetical protein